MIAIKNSELLCNMVFKHMMDIYNEQPSRLGIIDMFKKKFNNVRLTLYDDIIVCCEIESDAIFISQLGVFRYFKTESDSYMSLSEYLKLEYFSLSIYMDIYDNLSESRETKHKYKLIPLIWQNTKNNESTLELTDKTLSVEYLNLLHKKLSLYYLVLNESKAYYPDILE